MQHITINKAGLCEIMQALATYSIHEPSMDTVHAYAAEAEQSFGNGNPVQFEIGRFFSASGNPKVITISRSGYTIHETETA